METEREKQLRLEKANNTIRNRVIESQKNRWFVKHIENHITEMKLEGKVKCKICDKDIDQIADEFFEEWIGLRSQINERARK